MIPDSQASQSRGTGRSRGLVGLGAFGASWEARPVGRAFRSRFSFHKIARNYSEAAAEPPRHQRGRV